MTAICHTSSSAVMEEEMRSLAWSFFCELTIEPPAEAIGDGDVFFVRFFIFVLLGIGGYCDEAMETVDT